jgi:hypothetical protein
MRIQRLLLVAIIAALAARSSGARIATEADRPVLSILSARRTSAWSSLKS